VLGRVQELPELYELTGEAPPEPEETEEEHAARIWRNSMAWVIATGGDLPAEFGKSNDGQP